MTTSSDFLPSLLLSQLLKTKAHDAYHDMLTHYISMMVNLTITRCHWDIC